MDLQGLLIIDMIMKILVTSLYISLMLLYRRQVIIMILRREASGCWDSLSNISCLSMDWGLLLNVSRVSRILLFSLSSLYKKSF